MPGFCVPVYTRPPSPDPTMSARSIFTSGVAPNYTINGAPTSSEDALPLVYDNSADQLVFTGPTITGGTVTINKAGGASRFANIGISLHRVKLSTGSLVTAVVVSAASTTDLAIADTVLEFTIPPGFEANASTPEGVSCGTAEIEQGGTYIPCNVSAAGGTVTIRLSIAPVAAAADITGMVLTWPAA